MCSKHGKIRKEFKIFAGKPHGEKPGWMWMHRWVDNIKKWYDDVNLTETA